MMGVHFPVASDLDAAWGICISISVFYVMNMYAIRPNIRVLPRDNPKHIRARLISAIMSSAFAVVVLHVLSKSKENAPSLLEWIGIRADGLFLSCLFSLALTMVLFLGPIVAIVLERWVEKSHEVDQFGNLRRREDPLPFWFLLGSELHQRALLDFPYQSLRNFIVGPITEELVFRGCMYPLLICSGISYTKIVFLSPLVFGVAHLHHAYEKVRQGTPISHALIAVVFQLSYTSLFGAYAGFILLRTGNLFAAILCHMFCNFMGLPDLSFMAKGPQYRLTILYSYRYALLLVYLVGMVGFGTLLFRLTEPSLYDSWLWYFRIWSAQ